MATPLRVAPPSVQPDGQPEQGERVQPGRLLPAFLVGAVVLTAVALALWIWLRPRCFDLAPQSQQVREFLARGQPALAVGLAESALSQQDPVPCAAAKSALVAQWYGASMDLLLATRGTDPAVA